VLPLVHRGSLPGASGRAISRTGLHTDARLYTLFLALPVSWKGILIQYAGRLHRLRPDKTEVRIYDYVDRYVPMLARMLKDACADTMRLATAPNIGTNF
jgi:hypothetical protein